MNRKYNLKLDLQFRCNNSTMKFNQFDNNTSDFFMRITNGGNLVDIEKAIVVLAIIKPSGKVASQFVEVENGLVYADLKPNMRDEIGIYTAQAMLILEDERVVTDVISYEVEEDKIFSLLNDTVGTSEEFTLLTDMLSRLSAIEISEEQRVINEAERILSEENRKIEEAKRVEAELIRQHEEADRAKYDATRESNENIRKINEEARISSENVRLENEANRIEQEANRVKAEQLRKDNYNLMTEDEERRRSEANAHKEAEVLRVQAETNRVNEEAKRRTTEQARVSAENTRVSNENTRKANETTRQTNETHRVEAETQRQNRYNSFIADAEANTSNFENYTNTAKVKEEERKSNELDRKSQETKRVSNEVERISNENTRKANEVTRIESEKQRVDAENLRKEKIIEIQSDYDSLKKVIIDENASANLQNQINQTNSQLEHKANLNAVFSMANMGQDVKEAMTGGSVAVVGRNTILKENVVDKQITPSKTSFIDVENSVNLFNKNNGEIQLGGYLDASGEFKEYTSYFVGHKIDVTEGQMYTVSYAEPNWGGFYNSEGTFISKIGTPSGVLSPFTFTVPEGACYMRLNGIISSMNTYMIVLGDSLPSQYVAFYENLTLNESVKIEGIVLQEEYKYNISLLQNRFVDSLNLFDKTSPEIILGSFITSANGDMSTSTSTAISPYMPVKPNEVYSFKFYPSIYGSNKSYAFYDRNKNPVEDVLNCILDEETNVLTITVPNIDTIKYVRVNCSENDLDSFMFVKGETYPSEYIPGNATLRSNIDLNDLQKDTVSKIVNDILDTTHINSVSKLNNKVITFNGDSICAGAGYTGGYGKIIADKYNMTYENVAVSGGTITAETYSSSGSARHWISRTISKMRDDADYIVLEGGVNDASLSIPLGEITSDYISTLDDTTYCGAFESMLKQALEKYPGKKIGYIMVHKMEKNFDSRYEDNHYQMSKKICEKWGIPYLDLNIECPPLNYIPSLKATYTKDGDGWHPNELGYKKYYVDKIVHWLESL